MNPVNFIVKKYKNEPDEVWDSDLRLSDVGSTCFAF
jgi:hypothetical protein